MRRIAIIGAGAWGTALAVAACRAGRKVRLWAYEPETAQAINQDHQNPDFLPGVTLDSAIEATSDLDQAVAKADAVLLVSPAQQARQICSQLAPHWPKDAPCVICAKGIEIENTALLSDAVADNLPNIPLAVLSGPSFASEVARNLPTAITLACADLSLARRLAEALASPMFRIYSSDDVIGAQVGGAVKNVLALACGIVEGRGLGDNARAALITRGLVEMTRLAVALGGKVETLRGLAGLGDLTLTCNALQSRNFSFGVQVGRGKNMSDLLANRRVVTEGVHTAGAVAGLARELDVDMPICLTADAVLNHGADLDGAIKELLARPAKDE